jgi:hypothetical protein
VLSQRLATLAAEASPNAAWLHDLPFRILTAYEASPTEVKKLRDKHPQEMTATPITWPGKLLYQAADGGRAHDVALQLRETLIKSKGKTKPRMVMSSDGNELVAIDMAAEHSFPGQTIADLAEHFDFLLPLFGRTRYVPPADQVVDLNAAVKMRTLHDALLSAKGNEAWRAANGGVSAQYAHEMNMFMTRTLFCLFANRSGIFPDHLFDEIVQEPTAQRDGSDTNTILAAAFRVLNTDGERPLPGFTGSRARIGRLPYVNGGLFKADLPIPVFSAQARRLLIEATRLDWRGINADIFGSMMQAVAQVEERSEFGMHYTSPANIRKVIDPLFMDDLRNRLEHAGEDLTRLWNLHDRLGMIKIMDPACGSGNFLIVAYRDLRTIEAEVIRRLRKKELFAPAASRILLSNFHGIDPMDFACETTRLSLWITKYQMDKELAADGIIKAPTFPIADSGIIKVGNALRVDWNEFFNPDDGGEMYIIGNPPYVGSTYQTPDQKEDMRIVFDGRIPAYGMLDYVACWFMKAADHSRAFGTGAAFVATNSICQGSQVPLLWPAVLKNDLEIWFAYRSFPWRNSAKKNAGVTCAIIGIDQRKNNIKTIFDGDQRIAAKRINGYLLDMEEAIVLKRSTPLSNLPVMERGNQPTEGGNLLLDANDLDDLLKHHPEAAKFIRPIKGSAEFIDNKDRWCLFIKDEDLTEALSIQEIARRIEAVKMMRLASKKPATNELSERSHQFENMNEAKNSLLVIPRVQSERRVNLPIGYLPAECIVSNKVFAIYDPPAWVFSVIASRLHLIWTKTVGGRMKNDLSYSNTLVYNTFPMPKLSHDDELMLADRARDVQRARAPFEAEGRSIGWMYNPETMPATLVAAHKTLDDAFEHLYVGRPFQDDSERLTHLFKRHAAMTAKRGKAA